MAVCMYILRNANERRILTGKLETFAQMSGIAVMYPPKSLLLQHNALHLATADFAFELTDNSSDSALYLLSFDGDIINGKTAALPLYQRLLLLQEVLEICLPFAGNVEIYLGEDSPYLPDYTVYRTKNKDLADVIYAEYQKDDATPFLPCMQIYALG